METKLYKLPMAGTVKDWKTFTGDIHDPIRPVGVVEYMELNNLEISVQLNILEYHIYEGVVDIQVTADSNFHHAFNLWLSANSLEEICTQFNTTQLKAPDNMLNAQKPDEQLLKINTA